ncbi:MAG: sugar phosphate isomerase/epimerase [Gemmatirosa sp.]|nr:sugar phosphate isomerase/epimerase [Gemmatirosa sp.]
MNRRSFLSTLGAAAAAGAVLPEIARAGVAGAARKVGPIGLQLYTVRDAMQKDVAGTLARVGAIGYKEVEFAGYFNHPATHIREYLGKAGLTSPSVHVPIDTMRTALPQAIADAKVIGHEWITMPWLAPEQRPTTADGWKTLAAEIGKHAAAVHAAGLKFAYHNHDFEITPVGGVVPLEVLLSSTDPAHVDFEMDVYWVTKAGSDPLAWFAKHPGRFRMLHIKDASPAPARDMRPVGQGTINWRAVLADRPKAGTRHIFVEHDSAAEWGQGDAFKSVAASYKYLSTLAV